MESNSTGVSSSMEFKEPDKCDTRNIFGGNGRKTNLVPCDSTSGSNVSSSVQTAVPTDKKEAEKMTIDEASCG